jgi:membrane-associated phospholipid phosphatase
LYPMCGPPGDGAASGGRRPTGAHPARTRRLRRTRLRWSITLGLLAGAGAGGHDARAADPDRVEWSESWRRVRLAETLDAVALGLGSLTIEEAWPAPKRANWTGGILFDNWARRTFVSDSPSVQNAAAVYSDNMMLASMIAPLVIDNYVVTLGIHANADVAGQMFIINLQSLGLTGFLSLLAEHAVARQRPFVPYCGADGHVRNAEGQTLLNSCSGPSDNQSFYSGHAAITATMAGLTCVHHQHLPLYGGGVADLAPCLVMISASITTGLARLMADKHWASDVVLGWSIGTFSGYVLPSILHYGFGHGTPVGELHVGGLTMMPTPTVLPRGAGLGLVGMF